MRQKKKDQEDDLFLFLKHATSPRPLPTKGRLRKLSLLWHLFSNKSFPCGDGFCFGHPQSHLKSHSDFEISLIETLLAREENKGQASILNVPELSPKSQAPIKKDVQWETLL